MLSIPKLLESCKSVEQYAEAMQELRDIGQFASYEHFLTQVQTLHGMFKSDEKNGLVNTYQLAIRDLLEKVFTHNPAEAFPYKWLSADKVWMTAWFKGTGANRRAINVKVLSSRAGMRIALFKEILFLALYEGLVPGYTHAYQIGMRDYLVHLTSIRLNMMFEQSGIQLQQGVNCLYTGVDSCEIKDGRKQGVIKDKNYKGIPNLFVRREYLYLIKELCPLAFELYSVE